MKKLILALAAIAMLVTTAAVPSRADGNPESKCFPFACPQLR